MSPTLARLPKLPPVALAATAAAAVLAAIAPAPGSAQDDYTFLERACRTDNPYLITACYGQAYATSGEASVVAFRKAPSEGGDEYTLAVIEETGGIWGLAYSVRERAVYAAAVHKRQVPFGSGGAGGIYRIDLAERDVQLFARVPSAGTSRNVGFWGDRDLDGRDPSGKNSLGDLELSDDGTELYVVNLHDRRIYRVAVPSGEILGSFEHGASGESWAEDARPFGLAYHDDQLYHGVVNSAAATQDQSHLAAFVYRSEPDGSSQAGGDPELVAASPLHFSRGEARVPGILSNPPIDARIEWLPWKDAQNDLLDGLGRLSVYPQPILSDIEFDDRDRLIVSFADRHSLMSSGSQWMTPASIEKPGIGFGDAMLGWPTDTTWALATDVEHFIDRTPIADESLLGGLAWLDLPRELAATMHWLTEGTTDQITNNAVWYGDAGNRLLGTRVCLSPPLGGGRDDSERADADLRLRLGGPALHSEGPRSTSGALAPQDNEWVPAGQMGDVELLCGNAPTPTPVPSTTPTPESTTTSSPTPTVTPSPTATRTPLPTATPTPVPRPIYLPVGIRDRCDPKPIAVVLILDASTSMLDETRGYRRKMDAARAAAALFLSHLDPADRAAIVSFNSTARLEHDLTRDRAALGSALARIENHEYTRIDLGLAVAHEVFVRRGHAAPLRKPTGDRPPHRWALEPRLLTAAGPRHGGVDQERRDPAVHRRAGGGGRFRRAPHDGIATRGLPLRARWRGPRRRVPPLGGADPCPPDSYWPY